MGNWGFPNKTKFKMPLVLTLEVWYGIASLQSMKATISSVNNDLREVVSGIISFTEWKFFKCLLRWPKNQERKQWITDEEEMNLKENPNKAAFIILSPSFICSVWMNISFFVSVTDAVLRWHSSLTEHGEWNSDPYDETGLSTFTVSLSLYYTLVNL